MNLYKKYLERAKKNNIPIHDVMFLEYKKYILKATNDRIVEYLRELEPGRYILICEAMEQLDQYFNKRDYDSFMRIVNESLKILEMDIY